MYIHTFSYFLARPIRRQQSILMCLSEVYLMLKCPVNGLWYAI